MSRRRTGGDDAKPGGGDVIAIYAVDPGTTTGVARGVFDKNTSVWDGLAAGECESWEVEGRPAVQAWEIMGEFLDWRKSLSKLNDGHPVGAILVMEDFVIRLGKGASSRRELLDPVRVASGCEALSWTRGGLRWAHIEYQQPSEMSTYTNDRLRDHGMWVRGAGDHRHDAIKHMIRRYSKAIKA
jgi:hypothetical protein